MLSVAGVCSVVHVCIVAHVWACVSSHVIVCSFSSAALCSCVSLSIFFHPHHDHQLGVGLGHGVGPGVGPSHSNHCASNITDHVVARFFTFFLSV